ncbi:MAG: penicillin-binding protein activator [Humidesulfovibrio sp.]|uniref:penicillin-binding protein activator n=1 Tax=Humidesulfovibrio sp. TaxID=2910988 RepID=UPI002736D104|nr:penicillin-binding protein activator [Humidesulfovibrio sp.]MDP2847395.1 penicillin-binding protein activator [Humidesulfovibrio sp.]
MNKATIKLHKVVRSSAARLLSLSLLLATMLAVAGCAMMALPTPSQPEMETLREQSTADLSTEAESFWKAGNYPLAELLYSRLLERGDLDRASRLLALDRLAESSFKARHFHQAKQALDRRAAADKTVLGAWPWHELYIRTLAALNRQDLLDTHQAWLTAHTELPFEVRARAMVLFSEYGTRGGDYARTMDLLAEIHRQAPDDASRLLLERLYSSALADLPNDQLSALARAAGPATNVFPQALILREAARRSARATLIRPATIAAASALPGPLLAQNATRVASDQPQALLPMSRDGVTRVALVLPLTGRFGSTGQKVLRGAGAAQKRLTQQGRKVEIKVINAEAPDWREQLAALPASVAIVGGPLLNVEALKTLAADGALTRRAVFAFQPDLGAVQEGKQAWRFYPSFQDQARALVDLTANQLGIRSVAILAPKNRYGQRMAEVFQAEAKAKGLRVAANETYPPDDHPRWIHSVSHLLKIPEGFRRNKNMPLAMPDFGAVFMPEDWGQAEMLASNFHFFEGQHLLFLGTDLWSVGLDNAQDVDDTYFQQAACPGAWWPETTGGRALQAIMDEQNLGQADFWVALGYDFVRLSARLGLGEGWTPAEVNLRLAGLKDLDYSMAPVVWSAEGQARQNLYLFTPRKDGKALVDADSMRASIQKTKDRREKRLVISREIQKNKKDGPSGSLTRDVKD